MVLPWGIFVKPGLIIIIAVILLSLVVIVLPLLLSKPEEAKIALPTTGVVGLQFALLAEDYPVITRVIEESPALLAGIKKDDQLVSIDARDASMMGDFEINQALCGEPNSTVQVALRSHASGELFYRNLMRIALADLAKESDIKYLAAQSRLYAHDYLLRRDAMAREDDFSYTSLLMAKLRQGAVIVEFFDRAKGANKSLSDLIAMHNKKSTADGEKRQQITLITCSGGDPKYCDLAQHFRVKLSPVYIFIPGDRGVISARNVHRGALSDEQLKACLSELSQRAKQPIGEIYTSPTLTLPEMEEQNHSYTPLPQTHR